MNLTIIGNSFQDFSFEDLAISLNDNFQEIFFYFEVIDSKILGAPSSINSLQNKLQEYPYLFQLNPEKFQLIHISDDILSHKNDHQLHSIYMEYLIKTLVGITEMLKILMDKKSTNSDICTHFRDELIKNPELKLFSKNVMNHSVIFLKCPGLIKEFFSKQLDCYEKSHFEINNIKSLAPNGLLSTEGAQWKRHRKMMSMSFHFEFIKNLIPSIISITSEKFDLMIKENKYLKVNIMEEIQQITGDCIGKIFFGDNFLKISLDDLNMTTQMNRLLNCSEYYNRNLLFGARIKNDLKMDEKEIKILKQKIFQACKNIIEDKRKIPSKENTLLSIQFEMQKSNTDFFSDDEFIEEFITFYSEGSAKTGHLIVMTLFGLLKNPSSLENIKSEVKQIFSNGIKASTFDDFSKLEFMMNCFKETIRLWSPRPNCILRNALVDHNLGSNEIKKGTLIAPSFYLNNMDPQHFENPEEYNPGRWQNPKVLDIIKDNPFNFTPFSAGPKNCIGQHLAIIESKIILIEFLTRFNYELSDKGYNLKMILNRLYEPEDTIYFDLKLIS